MATKAYRNKPNRDKRNRTRKEKSIETHEVPHYVWADLKIENMPLGKIKDVFDVYKTSHKFQYSDNQKQSGKFGIL